ncbi:MAG: hypothetical protein EXR71_01340 [Myxococcales bacterium]|nr:hypothetical protein [Myxococcales bacterium]
MASSLIRLWLTLVALFGGVMGAEPLSIDVSFELGIGDTVHLEVLGQLEMSGSFPVGTDGAIDVPYAGRVVIGGFTLSGAKEQLEARLRDGYVLNPQVVLTVEQITSKLVKVTGGVEAPGEFPLTRKHTRVSDLLVRAGGLLDPSAPSAELFRLGAGGARVVVPVDLYLIAKGDITADVEVLANDTLAVPPALEIFVDGHVQKPGSLVFHDGMTVATAVAAAGGLNTTALPTRVKVLRGESQIIVNLKRVLAGKDPDVAVKPGDHINVPESPF